MCRKRPGPRCSCEGTKRYNAAVKRYERVEKLYLADQAAHPEGKVGKRRALQFENARRRLDAAKRVYYATPAGQKDLHNQKRVLESSLDLIPENSDYRSQAYRDRFKIKAKMQALEDARLEGVKRRSLSWEDYHLAQNERTAIRDEARERGGMMARNAHPMRKENIITPAKGRDSGLSLRSWGANDVKNARSWIEAGANPGFEERATVRPPKTVDGIEVGTERVVPSISRPMRMNTPDGQVVESRADIHFTKNAAGKYVVTTRYTVASTWEDSAPIDVTTQELGHILTGETGVSKRYQVTAKEFNTKKEAEKGFAAARKRVNSDAPAKVAVMARESLVSRLNKGGDVPLQQRNIPVWFRYAATDVPA